ncbi:MAG: hypothetical protein P1U88_06020 [Thalassobaculaceae bacterium]|nr:hypothetical protein [Thalassobaculaceae bacterium]
MTVTAGTDVYADMAEADAYFAARNIGNWADASTAEREAALLRATTYLDGRYSWIGVRADGEQPLGWPRLDAVDAEGRFHRGVPLSVRHACAELALIALSQDLAPLAERGGRILSERVGSVELRYADDAPVGRAYPYIDLLLTGLVRTSATAAVRRT